MQFDLMAVQFDLMAVSGLNVLVLVTISTLLATFFRIELRTSAIARQRGRSGVSVTDTGEPEPVGTTG